MLRVFFVFCALLADASDVVKKLMPVSGLRCSGNQSAWVLYPDDGNKYPLISFAHGLNAWDVTIWFPYLLENIAKQGYVVVAAEAGPSCFLRQHYDQIRSLEWALQSAELLPHIDTSAGTGIVGHSMGGGSTITSASDASATEAYNIKVAVAMHPASGTNAPKIPILYLTGTTDSTVDPASVSQLYKQAANKDKKTFANVINAEHVNAVGCPSGCGDFSKPPWGVNSEDAYAWDALDCYIKGDANACMRVHTCKVKHAITGGDLPVSECQHDEGNVGTQV